MKSIHIRAIDDKVLESLKKAAKRHHRSLQGELHYILEKAAQLEPEGYAEDELNLITVASRSDTPWRREEIYNDDGR